MGRIALLACLVLTAQAWAAEPIVGKWHLDKQEQNGKPVNAEPLVLQVTPSGEELAFKFSLPVNNIYFVSLSYTVHLDGAEGDVKNSRDESIGKIKMTRAGASQYKLTIRGPNRPASNTLTSESETAKQTFSRY
jgi:hypothetical protein